MERRCVLVCGSSLSLDEALIRELRTAAVVLRTGDTQGIESFLGEHRVDLLIIEVAEKRDLSDDLIKRLRSRLPRMLIMIVNGNGNREVIARAFSDGIVDAFHRPYDPHLIAERAIAILREMDKP